MGSLNFSSLLPTTMKVFILVLLIASVFIDIGSSKPTHSRKKRQLAGTGVALGSASNYASSVSGTSYFDNSGSNSLAYSSGYSRNNRGYSSGNSYGQQRYRSNRRRYRNRQYSG